MDRQGELVVKYQSIFLLFVRCSIFVLKVEKPLTGFEQVDNHSCFSEQ
jgi:hypothetical protein